MAASIYWNGSDHELRCNYLKNEAGTGAPEATYGISFPNGQGLDFSASAGGGATSSLLDDYEEGTWTPDVADAISAGNSATGSFSGTYTKIGDYVFASANVANINTSGMTSGNVLYIRNFPYASLTNATSALLADTITYSGSTIVGLLLAGQSYMDIRNIASATSDTPLTVASISSGVSDVSFTIAYKIS